MPLSPDPAIEHRQLNPWIHMWLHPRITIQQVIDTDPTRLVILIAMITGISESLNRAGLRDYGDGLSISAIVGLAVFLGPIGGIIRLYLFGFLIRWTGTWLRGEADGEEIRAAYAWSSVPIVWSLCLWIPQIFTFGEELFTSETPMIDADPFLSYQLIGFGLVEFVVGVWSFFIFLHALGQVQGFSAWKALLNLVLAALVVLVPLGLIFGSFWFVS